MTDDVRTLLSTMQRIESKLDTLIAALASDDDDDEPQYSLDGDLVPGERAEGMPL